MLPQLTRAADRIAAALALVAKAALAVIVIAVTADAAGRYLFSAPIPGTQAIVEGLLQPSVVFLAAALTGRRDGHMKVELLPFERTPALARIREIIFGAAITAFWLVCAWQSGSRAWGAWMAGQWPVGEIAVPLVVSYGLTCLGCAAAAVAHAIPLRKNMDTPHGH